MIDLISAWADIAEEMHEQELLDTPVPKIERETIFMTNDRENRYIVQTRSRTMQNHLESLGIELGGITIQGTPEEKWYSVPKNYVHIRKPRKGNPDIANYSEEGVKARQKKNKS